MNDIETNQAVIDAYDEASYEKARLATVRDHPEHIKVGDGATYATAMGGLYRAYTVIATRRGGKELDVQRDKVTVIEPGNFYADDGKKVYEADPTAEVETITKRKDGSYITKGQPLERWASRFGIGFRRDWTDMSQ